MRFRLASRSGTIVTARTIPGYVDVVEVCSGPGQEVRGNVAIGTDVGRRDMSIAFAIGWWAGSVVARKATRNVEGQVMVKTARLPRQRCMASSTIVVGFEMCRRAAGGTAAIMAIDAI